MVSCCWGTPSKWGTQEPFPEMNTIGACRDAKRRRSGLLANVQCMRSQVRRGSGGYRIAFIAIVLLSSVQARANAATQSQSLSWTSPTAQLTASRVPSTAHHLTGRLPLAVPQGTIPEREPIPSAGPPDSNWLYDVAVAAVGAFIGFGFAILLERFVSARRRKDCIDNIRLELRDLRDRLERRRDERVIPSSLSFGILTPVWDAVVSTGILLELRDEQYYDSLFAAYGSISRLSRMEDHTRRAGQQNVDELIGMRTAVLELLDEEPLKSLLNNG